MKNRFEGLAEDSEGRIDREQALKEYEKVKDPIIDAKAKRLERTWLDFLKAAKGTPHVDCMIITLIGSVLVGKLEYNWQMQAVIDAWAMAKVMVRMEVEKHGAH